MKWGRSSQQADARRFRGNARRSAFTLIEVLAAMLLIAIVLPAVMKSIAVATGTASVARRRTEAAGLAQTKLSELVATDQWEGGVLSGTFADWPDYSWEASVAPWPGDTSSASIQQIDLKVKWVARNQPDSVTLSTLAYVKE